MDLQPAAMNSSSGLVTNPLAFLQPTLALTTILFVYTLRGRAGGDVASDPRQPTRGTPVTVAPATPEMP